MELDDLLAYARDTYQIEEEHKWAEWPGFSVLCHPDTGKWIALCMRQWDEETGELIELMDLKCEQSALREFRAPCLSLPFRMKGYHWVGIRFGYNTPDNIIRTLLDRAVSYGKPRGYTVVLGSKPDSSNEVHRDTALPFSGSSYRPEKVEIPEQILQMRKMNTTLGDFRTIRNKTFYKQAVFMQDYEEAYYPFDEAFTHYFTTYKDLTIPQLRGYFSWRTKLRKGIFEPIPVSAAYIYVYELLNGIGTKDNEDRLRKLREFSDSAAVTDARYIYEYNQLKTHINEWIFALGVVLGLPKEVIARYAGPDFMKEDILLERLKSPREYSDAEVFDALKYFAGKKLNKTPVIDSDPQRGMALFAEAWRIGTETEYEGGKKLFRRCFGDVLPMRWYPLVNAVYYEEQPPEDREYILNSVHSCYCRDGQWTQDCYNLRFAAMSLFTGFVHEADCKFRRYLKTGRYLKEKECDAWSIPVIEQTIQNDRKARIEAARPKIHIDLSGLDQIRKDADVTRNSLLTEAEVQNEPAEPAIPEVSPAPVMEEDPAGALPLDPVHVQVLRKLLKGEDVKTFIKEQHLMPAIIADTINEVFYDEIGDTVLLCEDDILALVDDYREDVEQLIGGVNR